MALTIRYHVHEFIPDRIVKKQPQYRCRRIISLLAEFGNDAPDFLMDRRFGQMLGPPLTLGGFCFLGGS